MDSWDIFLRASSCSRLHCEHELARMQRIVLALALTGAAGLLAPKCTVRAPRAVLRAEAAEAPAEATPAPTFKVIDIPSDKCAAA